MAALGRRRYGAWLFTAAVIIALLAFANAKVFFHQVHRSEQ